MHEFIIDKCELISQSIDAVELYFSTISSSQDFQKNDDGNLRLDRIMMRLQAIM